MVQVLVADLHEATPALVQQLTGKKKAVPQVGEVGVDPQLPRIPKGADHLGLLRQVFVPAVGHLPLVDEGLEIGAVADPVRRIDVDHLYLAAQPLLLEETVHDQQAVARDQTVGPVVAVLVELDGLPDGRVLVRSLEHGQLRVGAIAFPYGLDDGARVDPFVDVEGDARHLEGGVFRLARPLQLRVEMGIVGVGLLAAVLIRRRGNQADGRVVRAILACVFVVLDFPSGFLAVLCHWVSLDFPV